MDAPAKILVLAKESLGGIAVFWQNVGRDDPALDIFHYAEGESTGYDSERGLFLINRYDPLIAVYRQMARHVRLADYDSIIANEVFELGFLAWLAPSQPISFIVHVNHPHSYQAAETYGALIDHYFCVSETGAAHLHAHGFRNVDFFRYSTFLPPPPDVPKQRKVVYVGRFAPDKNIGETLELLCFFREHGYLVRMIGNGPGADQVRATLGDIDGLIGAPRERVLHELAEASFLCHNSYVEGLPIIHTEAMHYGLGVICNYVDKSIHAVLGANALLWSDRHELLERMNRFRFTPPPEGSRINNPALNSAFLAAVRAVTAPTSARPRQRPPRVLDRLPFVPAIFVRALRRLRAPAS